MARKFIDFPQGLTFFTKKENSNFISELKKILDSLNVATADECCPDQVSTTKLPVSFNPTTGDIEFSNADGKNAFGIGSSTTNLIFDKASVQNRVAVPANVTQTLTAEPLSNGLITSTSVAATSLTLPTATALATELGAVRGTSFDFIVDNSVGASVVTVVVNTGITVPGTVVVTGSNILTVAVGEVAVFRLVFVSTTAAKIFRLS